MDAVLSFLRDARNWLIIITIVFVMSTLKLLSWLWERTDTHEDALTKPAATPGPVSSSPPAPVPPAPTMVAISPYCLPDTADEMRAWVAGIPEGTPIWLDDAVFTPAEMARIADVWERAAKA